MEWTCIANIGYAVDGIPSERDFTQSFGNCLIRGAFLQRQPLVPFIGNRITYITQCSQLGIEKKCFSQLVCLLYRMQFASHPPSYRLCCQLFNMFPSQIGTRAGVLRSILFRKALPAAIGANWSSGVCAHSSTLHRSVPWVGTFQCAVSGHQGDWHEVNTTLRQPGGVGTSARCLSGSWIPL